MILDLSRLGRIKAVPHSDRGFLNFFTCKRIERIYEKMQELFNFSYFFIRWLLFIATIQEFFIYKKKILNL